jgi:hypothetical protein
MENASGKTKSVLESTKNSLKTILTKPHLFFFSKPFALIYVGDLLWIDEDGGLITMDLDDVFRNVSDG